MLVALDVAYDDARAAALAAAVSFGDWTDVKPFQECVVSVTNVAPYEPGSFYRRELPCLLAVLASVPGPKAVLIVDGYVDLAPGRPGLGRHLFEATDVPVVGIAKSHFHGAEAVAISRGGSTTPLWITAAGMPTAVAATHVSRMHGPSRMPTLLRRVDALSRGHVAPT